MESRACNQASGCADDRGREEHRKPVSCSELGIERRVSLDEVGWGTRCHCWWPIDRRRDRLFGRVGHPGLDDILDVIRDLAEEVIASLALYLVD